MNTITLTDEQMKAIAEAFEKGQSITIEPPKPVITRWEPKGGKYLIRRKLEGASLDSSIIPEEIISGLRYQTLIQAEQAANALRSYARQLAWVSEHYTDYNISEKSYETDLILATLPSNIAYHLINEIQKGNVSL